MMTDAATTRQPRSAEKYESTFRPRTENKTPTCVKRKLADADSIGQNQPFRLHGSSTPHIKNVLGLEQTRKLPYKKGQTVYIRDKSEVWKVGTVYRIDGEEIHVKCASTEKIKCSSENVRLHSNKCLLDVRNLTQLPHMNEATVLSCLHERYDQDIFYTNAGSTVIATNPLKDVQDLYCDEKIAGYHTGDKTLAPHIYQIASEAYSRVTSRLGQGNQCIVVSGESGAGKTVSAKHLLKFITVVANPVPTNRKLAKNSDRGRHIQEKILQSSPILEAFGNAATPRNDNSSRFGKFIELQFHRNGMVNGAAIQTYLLEKTRVVHPAETECNFHIFYQLTESLSPDVTTEPDWLQGIRQQLVGHKFIVLPHGQETKLNRNIADTLTAMTDIGLTQEFQVSVFEVLCAVLFLGNIDFSPFEEESSLLSDDPAQASRLEQSYIEFAATSYAINASCRLLGISPDQLEQALLNRNITSGTRKKSIFVKPVSIVEAKSRKDCLSKLLYSSLFDWLLTFINLQIQAIGYENTIGLLDIYGFETFETNSLEQLCINYANEKIQQHYVSHFLRDLQREYEEECIPWLHIDYHDNQPCLNILEGAVSVFGILNEEVYLNRKSNLKALSERLLKLSQEVDGGLKRPKTSTRKPSFIIQHYAADVRYCIEHMVTKNKDNIPIELISLLKLSEKPFVQSLMVNTSVSLSPGKKKKTVLAKFKSSLDCLMASLNSSDVHYIRCIKPNTLKKVGRFDRVYVMKQLEACGIVETVRISQKGYSARMSYEDFHQRYGFLISFIGAKQNDMTVDKENRMLFDPLEQLLRQQLNMPMSPKLSTTPKRKLRRRPGFSSGDHTRKCCAAVLQAMFMSPTTDYESLIRQFGKTKLFLLQEQLEKLEAGRTEVLSQQATLIQRCWRRFVFRRTTKWTQAVKTIEYHWLSYKWRELQIRRKAAAIIIQRAFHSHKLRQKHKANLNATRIPRKVERLTGDQLMFSSDGPVSIATQFPAKPTATKVGVVFPVFSGRVDREDYEPAEKRLKLACGAYPELQHVNIGDGVITKRKIPKYGLRFHSRASVLKNAHVIPHKELECSITDCLPDGKDS